MSVYEHIQKLSWRRCTQDSAFTLLFCGMTMYREMRRRMRQGKATNENGVIYSSKAYIYTHIYIKINIYMWQ